MEFSILVAYDTHRVIGKDNQLIWHLPADLAHFKQTSLGGTIIMGRKTYESIGRPLPKRKNVVISRNKNYEALGCTVVHSLDEALKLSEKEVNVFVCGGSQIYMQAIHLASQLIITEVHHSFDGDAFFPEWDSTQWIEMSRTRFEPDEKNIYPYSFVVYKRK